MTLLDTTVRSRVPQEGENLAVMSAKDAYKEKDPLNKQNSSKSDNKMVTMG